MDDFRPMGVTSLISQTTRNPRAVGRFLMENSRPTASSFRRWNYLYWKYRGANAYNGSGIDVLEADWDNLIVLDACRADLFETVGLGTLTGTYRRTQSRGSATKEWLDGNFSDRRAPDTVYVTGCPMFLRQFNQIGNTFHAVDHVWTDGWNSEYRTVLPETMLNRAKLAVTDWPNKRLILHFMQPHYPFLTETDFDKTYPDEAAASDSLWLRIRKGELSVPVTDIWDAYRTSLARTLPFVNGLIDSLPGKTVVTADHGNMIGDRARPIPVREWGHPPHLHTTQLLTVPWLECPYRARKSISPGSINDNRTVDDGPVDDRLTALGYG